MNMKSTTTEKTVQIRTREGVVVSDKMRKTRVVEVAVTKRHPKYLKQYVAHSRFKAHDENDEYKAGDRVVIKASRPLSKEKRWIIVSKI
jgi:small subunit ribosomal protein S17